MASLPSGGDFALAMRDTLPAKSPSGKFSDHSFARELGRIWCKPSGGAKDCKPEGAMASAALAFPSRSVFSRCCELPVSRRKVADKSCQGARNSRADVKASAGSGGVTCRGSSNTVNCLFVRSSISQKRHSFIRKRGIGCCTHSRISTGNINGELSSSLISAVMRSGTRACCRLVEDGSDVSDPSISGDECPSSNGNAFGSRESERWQEIVVIVGRKLVLTVASVCVSGVLFSGVARAAAQVGEPSGAVLATFHSHVWPTLKQILAVFKDHGLLLSALLGLSAFFSMAETSIMTLWPWKVRELAEKEGEEGVFRLLSRDITRFLTTILIGTTVVNIAATALVTDAATSLFGEAGVTAATGVMTVVILLVTEIAPKSIAVHNATNVARMAVRPVAWLSIILYPIGRIVTALSMAILKILGLKSTGETSVSEEELKLMLRGAELSGAIEEEEQDMIENVLEIKDTYVREVMTPLVDVVAIDSESSLMEFRDYWIKHQYSRTPVYERRVDNIVGIAYAMDLLNYIDYEEEPEKVTVAEQGKIMKKLTVGRVAHRPAYFVPDSMSVWNLLREFRIRKVHMAIVLNEYGGAVGVVTLEDVVEEIVGEIFDESDSKEEIRKKTGYVVQRAEGVFDVDANTHIEDLSEALEVKMPEGPYRYETVSGFVCEAFGYIPRTGDTVNVILKKADAEDSQDRHEGQEEHQEENNKEKFQEFRLEILAGNARKVGAVRFQVGKSHVTDKGAAFPRSPGVLGKIRGTPVESGDDKGENAFESEDEFCEVDFMLNDGESEVQNSKPSEDGYSADDRGNGSPLIGSPVMAFEVPEDHGHGVIHSGSKGAYTREEIERGSSNNTGKAQGAKVFDGLERQQRINERRREVELAMAAVKQWDDDQNPETDRTKT